jgi:hypothetical protein
VATPDVALNSKPLVAEKNGSYLLSCSGEGFDVRVNFAPEASPFS